MVKAVIHLPKRQEDVEKLMREIARFRADKTLKILREQGVTPDQLKRLLTETNTEQITTRNGSRPTICGGYRFSDKDNENINLP